MFAIEENKINGKKMLVFIKCDGINEIAGCVNSNALAVSIF
ncbi:hypothetical protein [Photobacterium angustum]|nr:hypothetical protein [Photobacterium angustum]